MKSRIAVSALALCLMGAADAQAPKGPAGTTFVVKFTIKPGRNAEFERVMTTLQSALVKSEPGNLSYDLYLPSVGSQTYVLIEHYRTPEAVKAHGQDPNTQRMATAIKDLLDGPPAAERLILVSSKP